MSAVIGWIKEHLLLTIYFGVSTILILIVVLYLLLELPNKGNSNEDTIEQLISENEKVMDTDIVNEDEQKVLEKNEGKIVIELKGAIVHPGIYEVKSGDRVSDAITQAGGVLENADDRTINQALLVTDQMMIYIPEKGEEVIEESYTDVPTTEENKRKININQAEQAELIELHGIGQAKAQAIIDYREENGVFKSLEDIKNVSGIGDIIFENIKDSIMVD